MPQTTLMPKPHFILPCFLAAACLFPSISSAQQLPTPAAREDVTVTESRQGIVCDTFTNNCTLTQMLSVTVGGRKLELRMYEKGHEPLLALGVYPGLRVQGKSASSYRIDEAYILTYPDGKTERFDVIGLVR